MNNNNNLEWRRSKVQELASQGYNQSEISRTLQIRLDLPQSQKKHGIQHKTLVIPYCINNAYYQHVYDFG